MKASLFRLIAVLSIVVLTGCASGPSDPTRLTDKIKKGMTKEQVKQIAGKPASRYSGNTMRAHHTGVTFGDAEEVWIYSDGAMNLIPVVGLVRGARTNNLQVGFVNDRVSQVGESSFGMW